MSHVGRCRTEDGFFACRDSSACIGLELVCNSASQCKDGSDEGARCHEDCTAQRCSKTCQKTPSGPLCRCPTGYRLAGDNVTCVGTP